MSGPSPETHDVDDTRLVVDARAPEDRDGTPRAGQTLGRYIVIEELGRGGMGVVLRSYDPKLQREVALKCLRRGLDDHERQARMIREAQAMAKLNHRNVVAIYDVEVLDGQVALAMEFVRGTSLRRWLKQEKPTWPTIVRTFVDAGKGLQAAHQAGLLHRDFKPDNVLVAHDGEAKVTDFGIARVGVTLDGSRDSLADDARQPSGSFADSLTRAGHVMGTPTFMAPEQHAAGELGPAADQYAFCVSLWLALCGSAPFRGRLRECAELKRQGPPPWPSTASSVPRRVVDAIRRGLAPEPGDRWPSMAALLIELSFDPAKQRRRRLGLSVALGLAVLVGAGVALDRALVVHACRDEGRAMETTWNPGIADAIAEAFERSGVSYASETWQRARPRVDEFAADWQRSRTEACERAEIEGTWDTDTVARSRACFDELRVKLETLRQQWVEAEATTIDKTASIAWGLPAASTCLNETELLQRHDADDPEAFAADTTLRQRLAEVSALHATTHLDEALRGVDEVLVEAEQRQRERVAAAARATRGAILHDLGRLDEAKAELEAAFAAAERTADDRVGLDAAALLTFIVGSREANFTEGLRWAWLAECKQDRLRLGPRHPERTTSLIYLGNIYQEQGRLDEAVTAHRRAVSIVEATLGEDDLRVAAPLTNLGSIYREQGRFDEALAVLERARSMYERAFGAQHPDVSTVLTNIGNVYWAQGRLDEAARVHERAASSKERALGAEHPDVASALNNLGTVYTSLGRLDDAAAVLGRALAVSERTLGPDHLTVASLLNNLGTVHWRAGRLDEAQAVLQRALDIRERALAPEHAELGISYNNLGSVLQAQGRRDEALGALERALAIFEKAFGPDHPNVAAASNNLGRLHVERGEPELARPRFERALAIRLERGASGREIADVRFALARALGPSERSFELARQALGELAPDDDLRRTIASWLCEQPSAGYEPCPR